LPGYIPDIKMLLNRNVNEGVSCNPSQIGFTKDSRPSDHMFVLKTLIDKYLHKKEKLFACFVDFRKAFDTVAHTAIYLI
jgi:hypothetical protein